MLFILTADIKSCEIQQVVWGSLHACDFGLLCIMPHALRDRHIWYTRCR